MSKAKVRKHREYDPKRNDALRVMAEQIVRAGGVRKQFDAAALAKFPKLKTEKKTFVHVLQRKWLDAVLYWNARDAFVASGFKLTASALFRMGRKSKGKGVWKCRGSVVMSACQTLIKRLKQERADGVLANGAHATPAPTPAKRTKAVARRAAQPAMSTLERIEILHAREVEIVAQKKATADLEAIQQMDKNLLAGVGS